MEKKKFFLCYFETTRNCNIDCRYCMTKSPEGANPDRGPELNTEEIKSLVIDELKKYTEHSAIAFSGGEFLLRPDAMELLKYTAESGIWSFINTNGRLLTREKIRQIKKAASEKVVFAFSLNSITRKVHRWSRSDGLRTIVKAVKRCRREKVNFFFILTISKSNLNTLKETVEFLKAKQIPLLRSPFVLRGRGKLHPELLFDSKDMEEIIQPALREYRLSYISYTPFFASPEYLKELWKELNITIEQFGCQAAKGFVGISAEGTVSPCVHLLDADVNCGNVRETLLTEILNENEILLKLRSREELKGKCGICRYKMTCGGCRALSYYKSKDYLQSDPSCFFEPEDEKTVSEHEEIHNQNAREFVDFLKSNEPWRQLF